MRRPSLPEASLAAGHPIWICDELYFDAALESTAAPPNRPRLGSSLFAKFLALIVPWRRHWRRRHSTGQSCPRLPRGARASRGAAGIQAAPAWSWQNDRAAVERFQTVADDWPRSRIARPLRPAEWAAECLRRRSLAAL